MPSKRTDARARQLRMVELRNDDRRIRLLPADGEWIGLGGIDVDSTLFTRIEKPVRDSFQLRFQAMMWSAVVGSVGHSNRFQLLGFNNEFTVNRSVVIQSGRTLFRLVWLGNSFPIGRPVMGTEVLHWSQ